MRHLEHTRRSALFLPFKKKKKKSPRHQSAVAWTLRHVCSLPFRRKPGQKDSCVCLEAFSSPERGGKQLSCTGGRKDGRDRSQTWLKPRRCHHIRSCSCCRACRACLGRDASSRWAFWLSWTCFKWTKIYLCVQHITHPSKHACMDA